MQDALAVLDGIGAYEGSEYGVFVPYAYADRAVYIDLADDQWRAVKVTPYGWSIEQDVPVRFRRTRGQLLLPLPVAENLTGDCGYVAGRRSVYGV